MPHKNIKGLLLDAAKFPAAIEEMLPEGAPKLSTILLDTAEKMPGLPDFIVEVPDLPAPPELPEMPGAPALRRPGLGRYVTGVEVRPVAPAPRPELRPVLAAPPEWIERRDAISRPLPAPPEWITKRGMG